jgi:Domain of unknown function (DUF4398)
MFKPLSNLTKGATASVLLVLAAACATTPIPNEKIAVAKAAIQHAEQAGAPEFAPVQLAAARDKLARAEAAATKHDPETATQLAEQANADAQVAEATAQQQRSAKAAAESNASMQALRNETQHSSQPTQ